MTNVAPLPIIPLHIDRVFPKEANGRRTSDINVDLIKNYLFEGGKISKECLMEIMRRVKPVLSAEPNLLRVDGKVVIVGDIHGQFYDLVAMLRKLTSRSSTPNKILFLGDYVDRGNYGPEVAAYLFALKLKHPNDIFLLRGNHEPRDMAEAFNFRQQVLMLYDEDTYEQYMETFDNLPVASVVNGLYLTMHGGISHRLTSVESINQIERRMEPPDDTLLADLLWADPAKGRSAMTTHFTENNERGISVYFGKAPLKSLLKKEKLRAIVRAHQQKQSGYKFHTWDGPNEFPPCITVFSAPNYCASENDAAVMISDGDKVDVRTFTERQDKPFVLPERADAFSVFQPRLQGLVLDAIYNVLKFSLSSASPGLRRTLSATQSIDPEYLSKVVAASKAVAGELSPAQPKNPSPKSGDKLSMDELLAGYEEDLGLQDNSHSDTLGFHNDAGIAQEVNLLKQVSEQHIEMALKKEQSLSHGDAIDQYMPTENVLRTMQSIDDSSLREISSISQNDPDYGKKVTEIKKRAKQTKYKAMKNLNTANEKVPTKVKAAMVRRGSVQLTPMPQNQ